AEPHDEAKAPTGPVSEETEKLRAALGGAENILQSQPIAETRLLVRLRDNGRIQDDAVRAMGLNVFIPKKGKDVHILVGLEPDRFAGL
ncbi:MAG: PTS glucose transporter subunit IIBC, partial [Planctomycetes bacterium]|nr:PTS glucose transporter subunit IIBC [Planctomycetota bacterium]